MSVGDLRTSVARFRENKSLATVRRLDAEVSAEELNSLWPTIDVEASPEPRGAKPHLSFDIYKKVK
jgi:hypothetical protein